MLCCNLGLIYLVPHPRNYCKKFSFVICLRLSSYNSVWDLDIECPNIDYWNIYLFPVVSSLCLCKRSVDLKCSYILWLILFIFTTVLTFCTYISLMYVYHQNCMSLRFHFYQYCFRYLCFFQHPIHILQNFPIIF